MITAAGTALSVWLGFWDVGLGDEKNRPLWGKICATWLIKPVTTAVGWVAFLFGAG